MITALTTSLLIISACIICSADVSSNSFSNGQLPAVSVGDTNLDQQLKLIDDLSTANLGSSCINNQHHCITLPISTSGYQKIAKLADILADVLSASESIPSKMLSTTLRSIMNQRDSVTTGRVVTVSQHTSAILHAVTMTGNDLQVITNSTQLRQISHQPWFLGSRSVPVKSQTWMTGDPTLQERGRWTYPCFSCFTRRWAISYAVRVPQSTPGSTRNASSYISFDVDLSSTDIDQCDVIPDSPETRMTSHNSQIQPARSEFRGTHKCHNESSQCNWARGRGWVRGGYTCECRKGFYSTAGSAPFLGQNVETAFEEKLEKGSSTYDLLYACRACQIGCVDCSSAEPCLANYIWPFRIALLAVSMLCVLITFVLIGLILYYRRLKVIRSGSPIFLTLTLLGCATMYMETAAIFPVLEVYSCVATKWTRHMGFCLTYSALLLKTWRVSLTYRVKSAHKLKLTDKQLIQWLFPILLIMVIYLCCWTVSDPPVTVDVTDGSGLKFLQCLFGWWDHSIAGGEILFLCWGIRVCLSVRHAPSLFDEAKYISWAIYNIAVVNATMAVVHLLVISGPDVKYFLGFLRIQLSTTTTIALIFMPKFHRIAIGLGDDYDTGAQIRITTACIDVDGADETNIDVHQENEQLKEELQKLAAQMEFIKIVGMETNNPHLKHRRDGYFSNQARRKSSIGAALRVEATCFNQCSEENTV